jgi:D-3-phosphoglycerate dehydrogenase
MQNNTYFIIDFDSTFIQKESLEELASLALQKNPRKNEIIDQITELTDKSMSGTMEYGTSLAARLALFEAHTEHITKTITRLKKHITPSIKRNKDFFTTHANEIYIMSGGFKEIIEPIVKPYGIDPSHVIANTFRTDANGRLIGLDEQNPSAFNGGKAQIVKKMNLDGKIYVLGDGYNDSVVKQAHDNVEFFLFTENIRRESVVPLADKVISSFDEFLFHLKLPRSLSYPKSKMKVLLLEKIHPDAARSFESQGYQVDQVTDAYTEDELLSHLPDYAVVGIRSQTKLSQKVLEQADHLIAVGTYCIGTNQVDLQAASEQGIAVFNAPFSNTRSVVELMIGNIIMLMRSAAEKSMEMHKGVWNKSATGSHEIRGKKLGIIGYGNIGTQLSVLAESIGLDVYFYDHTEKLALGNATPCPSLEELLKTVDIVSLHVDGRKENTNLIGEKELSLMKKGSYLINSSRGSIVDIEALARHLRSGHIAGAAVDVFPHEPKEKKGPFTTLLQGIPNVILTPHIGGSTEEAQEHIASFVSDKLSTFIDTGETTLSVNFPQLKLPELKNAYRILHVHKNVPGMMAQINNILAEEKINIEGQYLKTNEHIGYVITDINKKGPKTVIQKLREIEGTIRVRILY